MPNTIHEDSQVLDTRGLPDPFASKNVIPAAPAKTENAWAPETKDARPQRPIEEVEDEQTWGTDPAEHEKEAATDFVPGADEATAQPEASTETEPVEVAPEATIAAPVEDTEEDLSSFTPNVQTRIRELNGKKKAAEAKASTLEQTLQQFLAAQQRQQAMQEQFMREEQDRRTATKSTSERTQMLEQFKTLGFDETNVGHWLAFEAIQKAEAATAAAQQQAAVLQQAAQAAQVRAYENELSNQLDRNLRDAAGALRVPEATRDALYEQAYAVAAAKQLADPAEAVALVLKPLIPLLRGKAAAPKPTKAPAADDARFNVMAASGRGAGQKAGQNPSGRKPKRDVEELEKHPWTEW